MPEPRPIELLAPARDLDTARAALAHGADAIYIGAPRFGARAAAGVSLEDLATLCTEAHIYGVRIYVTLNTILYDHELPEVERLVWDIYHAGADAIIVQDMALTLMDLPPIPLHSSTQCDTVEPEDAMQLEALGFAQIVLARELNVEQIRRIRAVTSRPLEVFVHGALCVSYSGRCYLSEALTRRSANRGECSQQCRLAYDLKDSRGIYLRKGQHLLSPRDLNRSEMLEALLDAGASSLKVEGRLKSVSYVKNITAHYRLLLDEIIARHPDRYRRASYGRTTLSFVPNPAKSFNRGFTQYHFHLATPECPNTSVINPHSPKSQGEYLGTISSATKSHWQVDTQLELSNGDGLLYMTPTRVVGGIKVNQAHGKGRISPARPEQIPQGSRVWRNHDHEWERLLSSPTATRRLPVLLTLSSDPSGLSLTLRHAALPELHTTTYLPMVIEPAKRFDAERIIAELSKLGNTPLEAVDVRLELGEVSPFIPLSLLSGLRRAATDDFLSMLRERMLPDRSERTTRMPHIDRSALPRRPHFVADYRANIANHLARAHYTALGYATPANAYELTPVRGAALMTTKHCIKHELGYCTREVRQPAPWQEPLFLEHGGETLRLEFDCARCQMLIYRD